MSSNKYKPHIVILPEDDANRQIVVGFISYQNIDHRCIDILNCAGGWIKAVAEFENNIIPEMRTYPLKVVILLIDFDEKEDRLTDIKDKIPENLKDRVFVLGVFSEPEKLKKEIGSYEKIGEQLAKECYDNTHTLWQHRLLSHNQSELERISSSKINLNGDPLTVKQIIFN